MRQTHLILLLLPLLACGPGKPECGDQTNCATGTPSGTTAGTAAGTPAGTPDLPTTSRFSDFVSVSEPLAGDTSCWAAGTGWRALVAAPGAVAQASVSVTVRDLLEDSPVPQATVEVFDGGSASGPPDQVLVSDTAGTLLATVSTCSPLAVRVSTDPMLQDTRPTVNLGWVASAAGGSAASVSGVTYQLIPTILGVSVTAGRGMVMGQVLDCSGQPMANAQVLLRRNGEIPPAVSAHYFTDDFPDRAQAWTSEDGRFLLANVPTGEATVEVWGNVDGELRPIAEASITSFADGFSLVDTPYGTDAGWSPPADCL